MYAFLEAAGRFARACDEAGVAYFLGGSAATTFHGEPRMTNDLDFVVDADRRAALRLCAALGPDFEADEDGMLDAARRRGSYNVFYLPDFTKIDVFFLRAAPFDRSEFERRQQRPLPSAETPIWVKSPEDSVLRKLLWFRDGGGVSDRQWRDIVMTLAHNRGALDEPYLDHWASQLDLIDLLASARQQASP